MTLVLSFTEFLEKKQQGALDSPQVSSRSKTVKICLGAAGGAVLLTGGILGGVVIRRKKRNA